jgi:hypothetical protein
MFAPEGWSIADAEPQINSKPTALFIDAIEDTVVQVIEKPKFDFDNLTVDQMKTQLSQSMRRTLVLQQRVLRLMSAPAIERYNDFLLTYPSITNRVLQRMTAYYLGITPEALSHAKKESYKK